MGTQTDRNKNLGDAAGASRRGSEQQDKPDAEERTRGTNRDFDSKEESANQGHGHPREETERR
jgi:hypothetical protein